eukprot:403335713
MDTNQNDASNVGGHTRKPSFFNSKKGPTAATDQPQSNNETIVQPKEQSNNIQSSQPSSTAQNLSQQKNISVNSDVKGIQAIARPTTGHHQHSQSVGGQINQVSANGGFQGNLGGFQKNIGGAVTGNSEVVKEVHLNKQRLQNEKLPQYDVADGNFQNFPEIPQRTVDKLKSRGIISLFPIQQQTFYPIYNREDVIARDLTGSGKTLAFGLPIIEYLRKNKFLGQRKVQAILLAPTRELAIQVQNELSQLKHGDMEFKSITVYGGVPIDDQARDLKYGVDIIVGTAGRVKDHIERGNIDFSSVKSFVLDEADRMLDLGFKDDIEWIMSQITRQCQFDVQKCLFSATIPLWVKNVARQYLKPNYRLVDLAQNLTNKTAKSVQHLSICCPEQNKMSTLADLLICYGGDGRAIVFTQTKVDANALILTDKIKQDIEVMHGDIPQNQREVTLKRFRDGKFSVLVATDVASRGLDIPNVDLVIQVEPPNEVETYIHRSGRTARAGKMGVCITFYTKKSQYMIQQIESQAGIKFKNIGIPSAQDVIRASSKLMLKNLDQVNDQVIPYFTEAAKDLIDMCGGNQEKALCKALAYISGYYKTAFQTRSLITGQERQITLELKLIQVPESKTAKTWRDPLTNGVQIFKKYFPEKIVDHLRGMKAKADRTGIVFDIDENQADRFIEIASHLAETDSTIDFQIFKCLALPELLDEEQFSSWKGGASGGHGSGFKHNRHQSFNVNSTGQYGGGFKSNNYGGGGFGNDNRGDYGNDNRGGYVNRGGNQGAGRGGYHSRQASGQGSGFVSGAAGGNPRSGFNSRKGSNFNTSNRDNDDLHSYNDNDEDLNDPYMEDFDVRIDHKDSGNNNGASYHKKPPSKKNSNSNIGGGTSKFQPKNAGKPLVSHNCNKLFIGSIDFNMTEDDLTELFQSLNLTVTKLNLLKQGDGRHKGAGFVEFASNEEADIAVSELDNYQFGRQKLRLEFTK